MEWEEFLLSEEFQAYRKRQADLIARTIHHVLGSLQTKDAAWLKGAMDMAFKLVRLPNDIIPEGSKMRGVIGKQIERDMADVSAFLITKSYLSSGDDDDD